MKNKKREDVVVMNMETVLALVRDRDARILRVSIPDKAGNYEGNFIYHLPKSDIAKLQMDGPLGWWTPFRMTNVDGATLRCKIAPSDLADAISYWPLARDVMSAIGDEWIQFIVSQAGEERATRLRKKMKKQLKKAK